MRVVFFEAADSVRERCVCVCVYVREYAVGQMNRAQGSLAVGGSYESVVRVLLFLFFLSKCDSSLSVDIPFAVDVAVFSLLFSS